MHSESQAGLPNPLTEIVEKVEKNGAKDWEEFDRYEQENRLLASSDESVEE